MHYVGLAPEDSGRVETLGRVLGLDRSHSVRVGVSHKRSWVSPQAIPGLYTKH